MEEHHAKASTKKSGADERPSHGVQEEAADGGSRAQVCQTQRKMDRKHMAEKLASLFA